MTDFIPSDLQPPSPLGLDLPGLRTRPLSSYLAALGLFRIINEQADPTIRSWWTGQSFSLSTALSLDDLRSFLLDRYRPTPLVAPWNGSDQGGFRPGTAGRASEQLAWVEGSKAERLASFQRVVAAARQVVATRIWQVANVEKDKVTMVLQLRNALPDEAVPFLDAAVALTADGIAYPPIFGTGGNIGRLDLVINYMEHLQRILDPGKSDHPDQWLDELLLGTEVPGVRSTPGQYDYQGVGGANLGRSGSAPERVNPWIYVLSLEGAMGFGATATRRLGSQRAQASAPFTVAPAAAGYASATGGEPAKGEMWMPVWRRPWSAAELLSVLSEGRATWGDRQARDGTDFLRAVRTLGIDRGIAAFERYAFLERNGQSPAAIPVGSVVVGKSSDQAVRLTAELDGWISRLNRGGDAKVPAAIRSARNQVNRALFHASERSTIDRLLALLLAVAAAERAVSRSTRFRDTTGIDPVPGLTTAWTNHFSTVTDPEFQIALLLASGHDRWDRPGGHRQPERSLREFLRPITVNRFGRIDAFRMKGAVVPGLGSRPVIDVLADVLVLRARSGPAAPDTEGPPFKGVRPQFPVHPANTAGARDPRASRNVVERFAGEQLDAKRLSTWLEALLLLAPMNVPPALAEPALSKYATPAPLWRLLAPWFGQAPLRPRRTRPLPEATDEAPAPSRRVLTPVVRPSWPGRLRQANASQLLGLAREVSSGYAAAGLEPAFDPQAVAEAGARRPSSNTSTLAALLVPTNLRDLADLATTHLRIDQGVAQ
ncbi:type I-G CRISPR-associated protein Cas8g1/Csx17 [Iamia sp.]|uniref:type I-G CRISPR-associated protein Cas8g1/Csx17 n=1 Tax=Iamia sp. TaxID=2722710 RepID=UPI002C23E389|nr:type I-U CRISPR-associated protein Csx17 [Iamia sp.]HXH58593.1 type I-U CRISPR-associated protein Csx17 [Iamia sp.]